MKEEALFIAKGSKNINDKINKLREYVQAFILRSFHESEAFTCLSFVGGTALRFLYGLPRFSEDLDFSLDSKTNYILKDWVAKLERDLKFAKFNASLVVSEKKTIHAVWVKIYDLLNEVGISAHPGQKISIKIKIDTNPPAGAHAETEVVNKYFLLAIRHYDLPSLMAGKVHALVTRKYAKGRDWYDLVWYRGMRPPIEPNLIQLQHALDQTEGKGLFNADEWKRDLIIKVETLDCEKLIDDVQPFLERPQEAGLLNAENIHSVLAVY